jgi:hypothetical protein
MGCSKVGFRDQNLGIGKTALTDGGASPEGKDRRGTARPCRATLQRRNGRRPRESGETIANLHLMLKFQTKLLVHVGRWERRMWTMGIHAD